MTLSPAVAACAAMVERGDPNRFAATMAAPAGVRPDLWPLYALNLEFARAPYASDEPMVAEMRLQWWVDQVAAIGRGKTPQGDVAEALAPILAAAPGIASLLDGIGEARRWECWREPFPDVAALLAFIDETAGGLMWAAARVLGAPDGAEASVRAFGQAGGIAQWLSAVPDLIAHGRHPLPGPAPAVIAELSRTGLERLEAGRRGLSAVPSSARPAVWTAFGAAAELRRALSDPQMVTEGQLGISPLRRALLLWRCSLTGRA